MPNAAILEAPGARSHRSPQSWLWRGLKRVIGFLAAVLASMTPLTAIFLLGALQHFMRRVISARLERDDRFRETMGSRDVRVDQVEPESGGQVGVIRAFFFQLYQLFFDGALALFSLGLATLPFSLLWLFSWWAGWENSFNKGYEQSWVGPTVGLIGVFVAVNVLAYIPMALAHQAAEGRWQSFFQVRRVTHLIDRVGLRYIGLAVLTVIAGLPLFAAQGIPVFIENIVPGFENYSPEQINEVAGQVKLLTAIYIVVVLFCLRWLAARLYARALPKSVLAGGNLWRETIYGAAFSARPGAAQKPRSTLSKFLSAVRVILLWTVLFGLVAQIFVAQFLNYQWWNWLSHPFYLLPWTR